MQTSKVVALLYAVISSIYTIAGIFMVAFGSKDIRAAGLVYVFMPIIMLTIGFLMMLLFCWLYNVIARRVGGIEATVEDK